MKKLFILLTAASADHTMVYSPQAGDKLIFDNLVGKLSKKTQVLAEISLWFLTTESASADHGCHARFCRLLWLKSLSSQSTGWVVEVSIHK
jgi:hypothetical protein